MKKIGKGLLISVAIYLGIGLLMGLFIGKVDTEVLVYWPVGIGLILMANLSDMGILF